MRTRWTAEQRRQQSKWLPTRSSSTRQPARPAERETTMTLEHVETIEGHEIGMELDGTLSVVPAVYGDDAQRICGAYSHLDEARGRRRAVIQASEYARLEVERARAESDQAGRQERADDRVRACRRHRAAGDSPAHGWTSCVAAGSCSGAAHGAITYRDECRCGAVRRTETNGLHTATSGWCSPRVE